MLLGEDGTPNRGTPRSHNATISPSVSMPAPQNNEIHIRSLDDLGHPPSPLVTEVDEDEGPSSVEAQADPSDLSFDLDIDLPASSYPLVSPQPSTSNDIFNEPTNDDQNPFAGKSSEIKYSFYMVFSWLTKHCFS